MYLQKYISYLKYDWREGVFQSKILPNLKVLPGFWFVWWKQVNNVSNKNKSKIWP